MVHPCMHLKPRIEHSIHTCLFTSKPSSVFACLSIGIQTPALQTRVCIAGYLDCTWSMLSRGECLLLILETTLLPLADDIFFSKIHSVTLHKPLLQNLWLIANWLGQGACNGHRCFHSPPFWVMIVKPNARKMKRKFQKECHNWWACWLVSLLHFTWSLSLQALSFQSSWKHGGE